MATSGTSSTRTCDTSSLNDGVGSILCWDGTNRLVSLMNTGVGSRTHTDGNIDRAAGWPIPAATGRGWTPIPGQDETGSTTIQDEIGSTSNHDGTNSTPHPDGNYFHTQPRWNQFHNPTQMEIGSTSDHDGNWFHNTIQMETSSTSHQNGNWFHTQSGWKLVPHSIKMEPVLQPLTMRTVPPPSRIEIGSTTSQDGNWFHTQPGWK